MMQKPSQKASRSKNKWISVGTLITSCTPPMIRASQFYCICLTLLYFFSSPLPQAAELIEQRVFGPEVPNKYKHPACITELESGELLIAYHGGSGEYEADTAVWGTRLQRGTEKWTQPHLLADTPFHGDGNPVVWQGPNKRVWLFYVVRYGKTWSDSRIQCKVSDDGAKTWSDSFVLAFEPGMMVRNQPIVLRSGEYLLPVYHEKGNDPESVGPESTSLFIRLNPENRSWLPTGRIKSRIGNIQPAVVELDPGHLIAFCRRGGGYDGRKDGFIVRSESKDNGETWSPGIDSTFPNPNAAVELLKLNNGHLILIFNDSFNSRTPLTAALSIDGGKTFPRRRKIREGRGDFGYPYAIQAKDGLIHLVYTSDERTVINHAIFSEDWVASAH
jgi:predicted neuraminidase